MTESVQWAPDGIMSGVPGQIMRLLAEDGKSFNYAPSGGWSFTFYSPQGDVKVLPGQWVTKNDDGSIIVTDEKPEVVPAPMLCGTCYEPLAPGAWEHVSGTRYDRMYCRTHGVVAFRMKEEFDG